MQIATAKEVVQTSNLGDGNTFTIAASAKAFEVLSSNLYQNKILAVVREISCNAADAHKAAGISLDKIVVKLPTYYDPTFWVRDYGSGLSKDDVLSLYTTYFRSTKDDNNDMIGGFGLGSKSPFAVADQFTVTSWHGGYKRTYVCYKDNGLPRVNVVGEQPSREPTGLQVQVAVKAAEISAWKYEAEQFFSWWPTRPQVQGATIPNPYKEDEVLAKAQTTLGDMPEWIIMNHSRFSCRAFMGMVSYAINLDAIPGINGELKSVFQSCPVVLTFNVGDLQISPSRETLSYDPATCAALVARLEAVSKNIFAEVKAKLAAQPDLYAARRYIYQAANRYHSIGQATWKAAQDGKVAWQGKPVKLNVELDFASMASAPLTVTNMQKRIYRKTWHKNPTQYYNHRAPDYSDAGDLIPIWTESVTSKTYRIITEHLTDRQDYNVLVLSGVPFDELAEIFKEKGLPPLVNIADYPEPAKATPINRAKSVSTKAYLWHVRDGWQRTEQEQSLKGGGVYLEFFEGEATDGYASRNLGLLVGSGWLDPAATRVIGLRRTSLSAKRLRDQLEAEGWQQLGAAWFQANVKPATIEVNAANSMINAYMNECTYARDNRGRFFVLKKFAQEAIAEGEDWKNFNHIRTLLTKNWPFKVDYSAQTPFEHWMDDAQKAALVTAKKNASDFINEMTLFTDANPMLKYVNWQQSSHSPSIKYVEFLSYINR